MLQYTKLNDNFEIIDNKTNNETLSEEDFRLCKLLFKNTINYQSLFIFKSTNKKVDNCIVAFIVDVKKEDDGFVMTIQHWNYHPLRAGVQLTHTTTKKINTQLYVIFLDFIHEQAKQTFQSLIRLAE